MDVPLRRGRSVHPTTIRKGRKEKEKPLMAEATTPEAEKSGRELGRVVAERWLRTSQIGVTDGECPEEKVQALPNPISQPSRRRTPAHHHDHS